MTPIPPRPGGVETATIVSLRFTANGTATSGSGQRLANHLSPRPAIASAAAMPGRSASSGRPPATIPESAQPGVVFRPRPRRTNRLRQDLQIERDDHHLPDRPLADALAAHDSLAAQSQMQNAPLATIHRAEMKRLFAISSPSPPPPARSYAALQCAESAGRWRRNRFGSAPRPPFRALPWSDAPAPTAARFCFRAAGRRPGPVNRIIRSGFSKSGCGVSPSATVNSSLNPASSNTCFRNFSMRGPSSATVNFLWGNVSSYFFFFGTGFTSTTFGDGLGVPRFKNHC